MFVCSGVVDSVAFGVTPNADVVGCFGPGLPDVQRAMNSARLASRFLVRVSGSAVVTVRGRVSGWP